MPPEPSMNADDLLMHVGWVRALARRVARDADAAEDLAQDALVVALSGERPREEAVGGERAALSTLDLVERAAGQRTLVDAVLGLEEPYRTTLLERYFEELSNERIAKRHGVSASTVATRVQRGLARLRARLRARLAADGESPSWFTALAPLLHWRRAARVASSTPSTGALLVASSTKILIGVGAAAFPLGFGRQSAIHPTRERLGLESVHVDHGQVGA
ncbi:MAG: sigma-70 family RNA polymerase sigma factor [bacterium]|nr:sigma-70 family RNA polymerase sigma factor [bacterium]